MADKYGVSVLGSLPININIRQDLDDGMPTLVKSPEGDIALAYRQMARKVLEELSAKSGGPETPEITFE